MSIRRIVQLVLDKAAAEKVEKDTQKSLKKGTDPKKPEKNLGRVKRSLEGLRSIALKVGAAVAGIWVVKKVFEFGKAVFQLGADVRAVGSQFQTVFGSSSSTMQTWIDDFRRIAGLTNREAQKLSASAGSMAQGFGLGEEEAASFSQQVLKLSGDLASFNNVPTAQAAQLVQSALIGNTEAARSLQVAFSAADVQARALANTGKSNAKELTQAEKALAALAVMTERAGPQIGDLARTQNDADNQAKQLAASYTQLKETLAAAVVGGTAGSTIFGDIRDIFEDLTRWVEANSAEIGHWSSVFITALRAVGTTAAGIFNLVRSLFGVTAAEMVRLVRQAQLEIALVVDAISTGVNLAIEGLNKLPGIDIDFRMAGQPIEEFEAMRDAALEDVRTELGNVSDALVQVGQGWLDVANKATASARTQAGAAAGTDTGGGQGSALSLPSVTGPALPGHDFLGGVEGQLVGQTQSIAENMRSVLQENDPFLELAEQADATAAFMRDGFKGVGMAIVQELVAGRAKEQFAAGLAALASGTWPPNPAALSAAGKHFAAAAAFRAISAAASGGGGGEAIGGVSAPRGAIGTSTPSAQDLQPATLNIYMDPLSPADTRVQRLVHGAGQQARERFGENVRVNVHSRTRSGV